MHTHVCSPLHGMHMDTHAAQAGTASGKSRQSDAKVRLTSQMGAQGRSAGSSEVHSRCRVQPGERAVPLSASHSDASSASGHSQSQAPDTSCVLYSSSRSAGHSTARLPGRWWGISAICIAAPRHQQAPLPLGRNASSHAIYTYVTAPSSRMRAVWMGSSWARVDPACSFLNDRPVGSVAAKDLPTRPA